MRSDNATFTAAWAGSSIRSQYVIRIDFGSADYIYLTSSPVSGLTGSNVYDSVLTDNVSGTSQKISPEKSVSTIGAISFSAVDDGLTTIQRTKLAADKGLRGKHVAFYVGSRDITWSNFVLAATQVVQEVTYSNGAYTFSCEDIQREMRNDIFEPKTTNLSATATANDATITVYGTTGFQVVRQPDSPGGVIDSPGSEVGYIKLPNGCIVRYTGTTATTFTGCTWGVLGTTDLIATVAITGGAAAEDQPEIEEFIYREGPAVMIAYELLTGVCYDYPSDSLPDHWHLGVDTSLVKLTDFENIGSDWWDTTNNDLGVAAVIMGQKKTDGKKFIEEQLYTMLGAFSPIYSDGSIGLKRLQNVHGAGSYVRKLDESDIVSYTQLTHDMRSVINRISVYWNWDYIEEKYTRLSVLSDTESQAQHGESPPKELKFRTLASSRHSTSVINSRFDSLRDRFAGPPLRMKVDLLPKHNDLEVGDIVRVCLSGVEDYTNESGTLDRNFEIQQTRVDWKTGKVSLDLFGSSQIAGPISSGGGEVVPDAWYSSEGTEINATNFPSNVASAAGLTTVSGDITLTGAAGMTTSSAIFYVDEDLTINAGVTVTIEQNVQLRVKGFLQVNGTIDGKGGGAAGQTVTASQVSAGYIGKTVGGSGIIWDNGNPGYTATVYEQENLAPTLLNIGSALNSAPYLSLSVVDNVVTGIPSKCHGSPGPMGGAFAADYDINIQSIAGGAGGASGAGLFIVCRGADIGVNGLVDTSGIDSAEVTTVTGHGAYSPTPYYTAGTGSGGYCGAVYWIIDGSGNNAPSLTATNSKAETGESKDRANGIYMIDVRRLVSTYMGMGANSSGDPTRAVTGKTQGTMQARENTYQVNHRIQYLS